MQSWHHSLTDLHVPHQSGGVYGIPSQAEHSRSTFGYDPGPLDGLFSVLGMAKSRLKAVPSLLAVLWV